MLWLTGAITIFAVTPDFAFPEKVIKQSDKNLKEAIEKNDNPLIVRSLIELTLANSQKDNNSISLSLREIEKIEKESSDSVLRSVLSLLRADILTAVYTENRWKYDQRELPLTPLPENCMEWSGKQFQNVIDSLISCAVTPVSALTDVPIGKWEEAVTVKPGSKPFFPTLFDFVAYKSINLLDRTSQLTVTPRWLCPTAEFLSKNPRYQSPQTALAIEIFQNLIRRNADRSNAYIFAEISRLKWVSSHSTGDSENSPNTLFNNLVALYEKNRMMPAAVLAPLSIVNSVSSPEETATLYSVLKSHLRDFPESVYKTEVNKAIQSLTRPSVNISYPSQVSKGETFPVEVNIRNAKSCSLDVYTVNPNGKLMSKIATKHLTINRETPFESDTTVELSVDAFGRYTIVPTFPGVQKNSDYHSTFICSSILPAAFTDTEGKSFIIVSDVVTGLPLPGVTVSQRKNRVTVKAGETGREGTATITTDNNELTFSKGADNLARLYTYSQRRQNEYTAATFTTSLPVYRPGDKMQFSAVVYNTGGSGQHTIANREVNVTLLDVNYQPVDTLTLTTDRFGRIEGEFTLPSDGLTGYFTLSSNEINGRFRFMVSDYKLPTFKVEITSVSKSPETLDVTVEGRALTYSGFPVGDAKVNVSLSGISWRWWNSASESFYTASTSTDGSGKFKIEFPRPLLEESPLSSGLFSASFDVTSPAGETRGASTSFSIGKPFTLNVSQISAIDIARPVRFGLQLLDPMQNPVSKPVECRISHDGKTVGEFTLPTPDSPLNLDRIEPGEYDFTFRTSDSSLADSAELKNVILYRRGQKHFTPSRLLWSPCDDANVRFDSQSGEILLASGYDNVVVNIVVAADDSVILHRPVTLSRELRTEKITLPDGISVASVYLLTVHDLKTESQSFRITTPPARRKLEFTIESFRDKVAPGEPETWTFSTRLPSGKPGETAVMLNMFSQAINDIAVQRHIALPYFAKSVLINFSSNNIYTANSSAYVNNLFRPDQTDNPDFNRFGLSWLYSGRMTRTYRSMMMKSAAPQSNAMFDSVETESESDESFSMDLGEAAVESAAGAATDENAGTSGNRTKKESSDYHPSEIPLALFNPMLTTDQSGKLTFSFTYPDVSTGWILNSTAFDSDLNSASISRTATASRQLMVLSNLPRFLRTGDSALLQATVMNNTDSILNDVDVTFTLLTPGSAAPFASDTLRLTLEPMSSKVITLPVDVPDGVSAFISRIRGVAGNYADGEQSAIAILPSSQPVIETEPFFIAPDSTRFTLPIAAGTERTLTLELCENPVWNVVTALPGLRSSLPSTSLEAIASYFSATVAEGIISRNPEIATALKTWLDSDRSDSTLVSMLERNSDLKTLLLNATPWVTDAMTDTERMTRLSLLFDRKETERARSTALATLRKLQNPDGGWRWTADSRHTSMWATLNILSLTGQLRDLGFIPTDSKLYKLASAAVSYIDKETAEYSHGKRPAVDIYYTRLRQLFPEIAQSPAAKSVSTATIQYIISHWRNLSLPEKGLGAIILNHSGYSNTAKTILSSLTEYATVSPTLGAHWANIESSQWWSTGAAGVTSVILDAYSDIDPGSPMIDRIRQWLILEKSRENWGSSTVTNQVIVSILTSGSKWTVPAQGDLTVTVGSTPLKPDKTAAITGYFRQNISGMVPDGSPSELIIVRKGGIPAYGALYSVSTRQMKDIAPASIEGLSIEKQTLVRRSTPQGEIWEEADTLHVGDIVKTVDKIITGVDLSYISITDNRAACLEPVNQLPEQVYSDGVLFYRENRDALSTSFIDFLPKGVYYIEQVFTVTLSGEFSSGIATIQSQYAPQYTAHSSGKIIKIVTGD